MRIRIIAGVLVALTLVGCATTKRSGLNQQVEQLQMQVGELETQVQAKDEEIKYLEGELEKTRAEGSKETADASSSRRLTSRQVQTALKRAGFYNGPIDGQFGKKTKKAVRDFQKANGLSADGIAGKKTRSLLRQYLD